jgi:phosphoenolpyruvate carboxylase
MTEKPTVSASKPTLEAALLSHDPLILSRALNDALIDTYVSTQPGLSKSNRTELSTILRAMSAQMHDAENAPLRDATQSNDFQAQFKEHPEIHTEIIDGFARMGHIHEISKLIARDNIFKQLKKNDCDVPGGIGHLVRRQKSGNRIFSSAAKAIDYFNKPTLGLTFTAHPTNTNSLEFMRAQRKLTETIDAIRNKKASIETLNTPLTEFASTPLVPVDKKGAQRTLNVREETDQMIYFLENLYWDTSRIYKQFDAALKDMTPIDSPLEPYNPLNLKLPIDLSSWGSSGDKDGNKNVNAYTTLEAIALHRQKILSLYKEALEGEELKNIAGLDGWRKDITQAEQNAQDALKIIEENKPKTTLSEEQWKQASDLLKGTNLSAGKFIGELENTYTQLPKNETEQAALLKLVRRARIFGFSMGRIEYRETAEEYERVVAAIIPEYGKLYADLQTTRNSIKQQETLLKTITAGLEKEENSPEEIQRLKGEKETCETRLKELNKTLETQHDAFNIHDPERKKILSDYLNNPQKLTHALAAAQARIHDAAGKPYDTADAAPIAYHTLKRMELARDFPDMITDNVLAECQTSSNMLEALLIQKMARSGDKEPKLGIVPLFEEHTMLERSKDIIESALDNSKYKEHLNSLKERYEGRIHQQVQFAHSDNARRAGMCAARAYIYEAHQKLRILEEEQNRGKPKEEKIHFQFFEGGSQSDPYRGGVRAMSATVNEFGLHNFAKFTFQGGDLLNIINYPASAVRSITRAIAHRAEILFHKDQKTESKKPVDTYWDDLAVRALKLTREDYERRYFNNPDLDKFLKQIGYLEEARAGNVASRATARGTGSATVNAKKSRTIAFSEAFQHAGICPTWIGSCHLKTHLSEENGGKPLTAEQLHTMYETSPIFADVIDRMLYGLAMTNLEELGKKYNGRQPYSNMYTDLEADYRKAFSIAMKARTGKEYESFNELDDTLSYGKETLTELRDIVINEGLPQLAPDLNLKQRYLSTVNHMINHVEKGEKDENNEAQRRLLHNAADTALHARILMADDPATAKFVDHLDAAKGDYKVANDNYLEEINKSKTTAKSNGRG